MEVAPESSRVRLFDGGFEFDWDSSAISLPNGEGMTLINGERVQAIQNLDGDTHKQFFESVKNGEYWVIAWCPVAPGTADYGGYVHGYRKIIVNKNIHNTTLKFVFTDEDRVHAYYKPFKEK